jgi:hypothetical protein
VPGGRHPRRRHAPAEVAAGGGTVAPGSRGAGGHRVPADQAPQSPPDVPVAGIIRLPIGRYHVDVGRTGSEQDGNPTPRSQCVYPCEKMPRSVRTTNLNEGFQRIEPFLGFGGISVLARLRLFAAIIPDGFHRREWRRIACFGFGRHEVGIQSNHRLRMRKLKSCMGQKKYINKAFM